MRYLITYSKQGGPMIAYLDHLEDATLLAARLRRVGYYVQIWAVDENGAIRVKEDLS